jgi:26S proteasome regulatory subunit N3
VLKIGLRKISISYSRISLTDVAQKLHLPSAAAAEYICAKAIRCGRSRWYWHSRFNISICRDGVIEAKIDHENGWLSSDETVDVYSTEEPQKAFHKRIQFCLGVHNDAVKVFRIFFLFALDEWLELAILLEHALPAG